MQIIPATGRRYARRLGHPAVLDGAAHRSRDQRPDRHGVLRRSDEAVRRRRAGAGRLQRRRESRGRAGAPNGPASIATSSSTTFRFPRRRTTSSASSAPRRTTGCSTARRLGSRRAAAIDGDHPAADHGASAHVRESRPFHRIGHPRDDAARAPAWRGQPLAGLSGLSGAGRDQRGRVRGHPRRHQPVRGDLGREAAARRDCRRLGRAPRRRCRSRHSR